MGLSEQWDCHEDRDLMLLIGIAANPACFVWRLRRLVTRLSEQPDPFGVRQSQMHFVIPDAQSAWF